MKIKSHLHPRPAPIRVRQLECQPELALRAVQRLRRAFHVAKLFLKNRLLSLRPAQCGDGLGMGFRA